MRGARAWAIALLFGSACGGSGVSCPNDTIACPSAPPSYANQVSGIFQRRCLACHSPGGQEASRPFTNYQEVFSNRGAILDQVYSCRMPPEGNTPPTADERAQLIGWLACNAPNN